MMRILLRRMPIAQINSGATKDEGDPEEKGVDKCESMDRYWNPPSVHWRNGEDACMREHSMCKPSTCWIIGLRNDTYQQLTRKTENMIKNQSFVVSEPVPTVLPHVLCPQETRLCISPSPSTT